MLFFFYKKKTLKSICDILTPDDLRVLVETEDEFNRRGSFLRIFPNAGTKKYLKFFETTRYYNILLSEWIDKFKSNRERAVSLLNTHCKRKAHHHNPAEYNENKVKEEENIKN